MTTTLEKHLNHAEVEALEATRELRRTAARARIAGESGTATALDALADKQAEVKDALATLSGARN